VEDVKQLLEKLTPWDDVHANVANLHRRLSDAHSVFKSPQAIEAAAKLGGQPNT
jgi:hypothetical protein